MKCLENVRPCENTTGKSPLASRRVDDSQQKRWLGFCKHKGQFYRQKPGKNNHYTELKGKG